MRLKVAASVMAAGLIVTALGLYLFRLCTWSYADLCIRRDYELQGAIIAMIGAGILALDLSWMAGLWRPIRRPMPDLHCPRCGHRLDWIQDSDQWYCPRCGEYRLSASESQPRHGT